jgi:HD-like signal output (HDOD) protein
MRETRRSCGCPRVRIRAKQLRSMTSQVSEFPFRSESMPDESRIDAELVEYAGTSIIRGDAAIPEKFASLALAMPRSARAAHALPGSGLPPTALPGLKMRIAGPLRTPDNVMLGRMHSSDSTVQRRSQLDFLTRMKETLAAGIIELPAFPQVVIKVQEAYKDPNYTPQLVARLISAEPSLARRLLDIANSVAFNATGRVIIDLGLALTRLGAQKVYGVVIAHAIQDIRRTESLRSIAGRMDELWSNCVAVAHFSQAVAKRASLPTPDAFAAGLLHLIGRLYILVQCTEQGTPGHRVTLSNDLVDAWHPAIAKAVLKNWGMSQEVCEAVGAQEEVDVVRTGNATLTDVLITGIRLANRMKHYQDAASLSAGGVLARLNLSIEECLSLVDEAATDVRALERALVRS